MSQVADALIAQSRRAFEQYALRSKFQYLLAGFLFYAVKPLMPILPLLPIMCVRENSIEINILFLIPIVVMTVPAKKIELAMSQLVDSVEALSSPPMIPEL